MKQSRAAIAFAVVVSFVSFLVLSPGLITNLHGSEIGRVTPPDKDPTLKINSLLREVKKAAPHGPQAKRAVGQRLRPAPDSIVRRRLDNFVQVYIHLDDINEEKVAFLQGAGVEVETVNESLGIVQGWLNADLLDSVAQIPFVRRIAPPAYATVRSGSVTTEAGSLLGVDRLRSSGFEGTGVKVGVISDGITNIASAQASGDLPAVATVTYPGDGDEGTAMLEIIHDLAPGAELGFCGPATSLEFIQCVNDLANSFGADIIVDDLGFLDEPCFEDGPVAQAVAQAVASGVVYVSSAGNDAQQHYEADFVETSSLGLYGPEHNFGLAGGGSNDSTMNLLVGPHQAFSVFLQWNDPFGSSSNDYDLLLFDGSTGSLIVQSQEVQDGDDLPLEAVSITNNGNQAAPLLLVIVKYAGEGRRLEMYLYGGVVLEEYQVAAGSIFGHPAVPGVLAAGAISAGDPGIDEIEPFSSRGPVEIFFPAYESRQKPDICALDGVSVTGAGGFPTPFFGTSASAPHLAAIAALMKGTYPERETMVDRLKETAVDLGEPGFDLIFGAGRVDPLAALNIPPESSPEQPPVETPPSSETPPSTEPPPEETNPDESPEPSETPEDEPQEADSGEDIDSRADTSSNGGGCALILK